MSPTVDTLTRRLARAFVCAGPRGRIHSSFLIGLGAVTLTVAFLMLTFGVYDSYAAKLETIALSIYPHVIVIDQDDSRSKEGTIEGGSVLADDDACVRICAGDVVLHREDEADAALRTSLDRQPPLIAAVAALDRDAWVAPLLLDEADFVVTTGGEGTAFSQRLRVLGVAVDPLVDGGGVDALVPQVGRFVSPSLLTRLAAADDALLVSSALRARLGDAGDVVSLRGPDGVARRFEVAGTFELGFHTMAETMVITSLAGAQALLDMPNEASYFGITLDDPYAAEDRRRALRPSLDAAGFVGSDWMGIASGDFATIRLFRAILVVVLGMSLLVAALGIRNTLTIVTVERRRQIGILRAIGLKDAPIRWVFLWIALGLGALGTALGLPLGALASRAFGHWLDRALVEVLPIHGVAWGLQPSAAVQVTVLVLVACVATALVSVRRALALAPTACLAAE